MINDISLLIFSYKNGGFWMIVATVNVFQVTSLKELGVAILQAYVFIILICGIHL
jgi:hypothetical protein